MELEHTFTVPVPPARAFAVLQDIERIGPCMPGATIESVDGRSFTGNVKVKIGPIKVTYAGEASYAELDEEGLTATIDARGRESRGTGTANARVAARLTEVAEGTRVHVVTDLAITGKPAQFGRGVMEEVGQKLISQFADCLSETLASDDGGAADGTAATSTADDADAGAAAGTTEPATAEAAGTAASTSPPVRRPEPEAIDLLDVAGAPLAKRAAPLAGALALLLLIRWLRRR